MTANDNMYRMNFALPLLMNFSIVKEKAIAMIAPIATDITPVIAIAKNKANTFIRIKTVVISKTSHPFYFLIKTGSMLKIFLSLSNVSFNGQI